MTGLSEDARTSGDLLVDALLDAVDLEPEESRARLYAAIKAGTYSVTVDSVTRVVRVRFPSLFLTWELLPLPTGMQYRRRAETDRRDGGEGV